MNEAEETLKKKLEKKGYTVYRNGWPDFIVQREDEIIAIEVKSHQTEKLEENQLSIMELLSSLGIKCQRWSPDKGFQKFDAVYVRPPRPPKLPKKGSKQYCELITKVEGGEKFIRKIVVHGRPYYQRCQWIYVNGKRKLKILKHLGTRKPRERIRGVRNDGD